MKVSGSQNPSITNLEKSSRAKTLDNLQQGNPKQVNSGQDKLNLSARAQEVAKAKELATPSQEIDEAKVARLQGMIDAGEYKVDSGAIADKLLAEHSTLRD